MDLTAPATTPEGVPVEPPDLTITEGADRDGNLTKRLHALDVHIDCNTQGILSKVPLRAARPVTVVASFRKDDGSAEIDESATRKQTMSMLGFSAFIRVLFGLALFNRRLMQQQAPTGLIPLSTNHTRFGLITSAGTSIVEVLPPTLRTLRVSGPETRKITDLPVIVPERIWVGTLAARRLERPANDTVAGQVQELTRHDRLEDATAFSRMGLYVFRRRDARIYAWPFDNVYNHGGVCWGLVPSETIKGAGTLQGLDELFLRSVFNADLASGLRLSRLTAPAFDKPVVLQHYIDDRRARPMSDTITCSDISSLLVLHANGGTSERAFGLMCSSEPQPVLTTALRNSDPTSRIDIPGGQLTPDPSENADHTHSLDPFDETDDDRDEEPLDDDE